MKLLWNRHTRVFVLWMLRWFYPVKQGRVMLVSWNGAQYNCNPRAIAEAIVKGKSAIRVFRLNYAFVNPDNFPDVPAAIHKVQIGSLEYYRLLATSQFIISNIRFAGLYFPYKKRKQLYIQTMHGGHGLKRVEMDADLPASYQKSLLEDASRTDLMISDSRFWTELAHTAFRFPGEVLEEGLPRNDVFFSSDEDKLMIRRRVLEYVELPDDDSEIRLLIYTPTFRNNGRRDVYGFDVRRVTEAMTKRFGGKWFVLVSSHPNMRTYYKEIYNFSNPALKDVGMYPDLQDILISGDVCITDYSSAGMEFCLTGRPVFLLARDMGDYDRGFYFDMHALPWSLAETDDELIRNIESFDEKAYKQKLSQFNEDVIGLNETGHASEAVISWMLKHVDGAKFN
ncbi:MAG: CDP-glycerol glycerophosphotransferase family protein [Bacteroidales bacterium]|nr:CDP-glycerol glycerophosphotransferase family protein [Bacteroidales bacterium]